VREVRFSPRAVGALADLHAFIQAENPPTADAMVRRLVDRSMLLSEHPDRGARRDRLGTGVRCLIEAPYLIFYERIGDDIEVLRSLHGARRITRALPRGP
jgi:toxin ParE1/3/4